MFRAIISISLVLLPSGVLFSAESNCQKWVRSYLAPFKLSMKREGLINKGLAPAVEAVTANLPGIRWANQRALQLSNRRPDQNVFSKAIVLLKKIKNLQRALYIFVSPNSIIPNHVDDEDECFRMVTGVLTPDNIGLVLDDEPVQLKKSQTIGFSASEVWHHGWNNSNQYWSMLTLCIKDKKLDGIRKIY